MKIAIPIREKTQKQAIAKFKEAGKKADIAEIWLDHIKDLDLKALLKAKTCPVICVCKKPIEKGLFKGRYADMADILIQAVQNSADYIDIPLKMPKKLNKKIVQYIKYQQSEISNISETKIIISYHNFKKTPKNSELRSKVKEMLKRGADVVKIAVKANNLEDTMRIIMLAQELQSQKIRHILIAMGKKGILSRVITPLLGGEMMFAPLSKSQSTAKGQLTVSELKEVWSCFSDYKIRRLQD